MNRTNHITARRAARAARPMLLGFSGIAGKRVTGLGPAPV
jgi:hypothetical protein